MKRAFDTTVDDDAVTTYEAVMLAFAEWKGFEKYYQVEKQVDKTIKIASKFMICANFSLKIKIFPHSQ